MGLLDKLWDDTVAGPRPENGLSKLRKYATLPSRSSTSVHDDTQISCSIPVIKPPTLRSLSLDSGSAPSSPADSSAPSSPFSVTPRGDLKKLRKCTSDAYERAEVRSTTVYDWVIISALDI